MFLIFSGQDTPGGKGFRGKVWYQKLPRFSEFPESVDHRSRGTGTGARGRRSNLARKLSVQVLVLLWRRFVCLFLLHLV